jgi:hypothetical protein
MAGLTHAHEVMCPECGRYLDKGELVPRPLFPPLWRFVLRLTLPHGIAVGAIVVLAGLCMLVPKDASLVAAAIVACYLPLATMFIGMVDAVGYFSSFARRPGQWPFALTATIVTLVGGVVELVVGILMARVVAP